MKQAFTALVCAVLACAAAAQTVKPSAARLMAKAASPAELSAPASVPSTEALTSLPAGTALSMKLETAISTRTNKAGDRFSGRVTEDVKLEGRTIIPVGASVEGRVARAEEHRRFRGTPTIDLRPEAVVMPNGDHLTLNAVIVDTDARPDVDVNDEGRLQGRGHNRGDWQETGIAAGVGAIAGGMIAGGHGALIGSGAGATASVVHWLIQRRSAELPAGTEIVMELSRPMSLSASSAGQ